MDFIYQNHFHPCTIKKNLPQTRCYTRAQQSFYIGHWSRKPREEVKNGVGKDNRQVFGQKGIQDTQIQLIFQNISKNGPFGCPILRLWP